MSHTNSTANYNLPQFVTTDKPAWLTDINNAFLAIDTGMDAAKDAADAAQADATQALSDASGASTAASAADAKATGSLASIATTFDTTSTYSVGDHVIYNGLLYICSTAVTTPGAWNSSYWTRDTIDNIITHLDASDIIYGTRTVAYSLFNLIDDTYAITKGSSMPSGFPTPSNARRGCLCQISFAVQLPARNYASTDVLWNVSKAPNIATRAIVQLGGQNVVLNVLTDGTVSFNSNQNLSAATWLIGEVVYVTDF